MTAESHRTHRWPGDSRAPCTYGAATTTTSPYHLLRLGDMNEPGNQSRNPAFRRPAPPVTGGVRLVPRAVRRLFAQVPRLGTQQLSARSRHFVMRHRTL